MLSSYESRFNCKVCRIYSYKRSTIKLHIEDQHDLENGEQPGRELWEEVKVPKSKYAHKDDVLYSYVDKNRPSTDITTKPSVNRKPLQSTTSAPELDTSSENKNFLVCGYKCVICGNSFSTAENCHIHCFCSHNENIEISLINEWAVHMPSNVPLLQTPPTPAPTLTPSNATPLPVAVQQPVAVLLPYVEDRKHCCDFCTRSFLHRRAQMHHMETHHSHLMDGYKCSSCSATFYNPVKAVNHFENQHGGKVALQEVTDTWFIVRSGKTATLLSTGAFIPLPKTSCSPQVKAQATITSGEKVRLFDGGDIFSVVTKDSLNGGKMQLPTLYNCPECQRQFYSLMNVKNHYILNHGDKKQLPKTFMNPSDSLPNPTFHYKCPVCEEQFTAEDLMDEHLKLVHHVGGFSCNFCKKGKKITFLSLTSLEHHMRAVHPQNIKIIPEATKATAATVTGATAATVTGATAATVTGATATGATAATVTGPTVTGAPATITSLIEDNMDWEEGLKSMEDWTFDENLLRLDKLSQDESLFANYSGVESTPDYFSTVNLHSTNLPNTENVCETNRNDGQVTDTLKNENPSCLYNQLEHDYDPLLSQESNFLRH